MNIAPNIKKRALIIGANGQDGIYLTKLLNSQGISLMSISRSGVGLIGDVGNFDFIQQQIRNYQPDYIFHLAANSTTKHDAVFENHNSISLGSINVLEATMRHCPKARIFLSGSALQFKNLGQPIDEKTPFEATSPYAVSRIASVYSARYYRQKYNLKIYIGYFFNHDSPLRTEEHINQKIIRAVQRINNGSLEKIELGNIAVKKEFNYCGDIVDAIWLLINQNTIFEAVIGSGKAYSIRDWLEYCFKKIHRDWIDYVHLNNSFVPEYDTLVSNPKLIQSLGWVPKTSFTQLADLMMNCTDLNTMKNNLLRC